VREYLETQYAVTQAILRRQGRTRVRVYRGIRGEQAAAAKAAAEAGGRLRVAVRDASSWSTEESFAAMWAKALGGVTLEAEVPAEQIFALVDGEGRFVPQEHEVVLLFPDNVVELDAGAVQVRAESEPEVTDIDLAGDDADWLPSRETTDDLP
jgi:uncharacterized cupin superfamily protein